MIANNMFIKVGLLHVQKKTNRLKTIIEILSMIDISLDYFMEKMTERC